MQLNAKFSRSIQIRNRANTAHSAKAFGVIGTCLNRFAFAVSLRGFDFCDMVSRKGVRWTF